MKSVGEVMGDRPDLRESFRMPARPGSAVSGWGWRPTDPLGRRSQPLRDIPGEAGHPHTDRLVHPSMLALRYGDRRDLLRPDRIDPCSLTNNLHDLRPAGRPASVAVGATSRGERRLDPARRSKRVLLSPPGSSRTVEPPPTRPSFRADRKRPAGIEARVQLVADLRADFEAVTPTYYATYGVPRTKAGGGEPRVVILGGRPNRIARDPSFATACARRLRAAADGYEVVMVTRTPRR